MENLWNIKMLLFQYKRKLFKKACHLYALTKMGCRLLAESIEASNESGDLINDTPTSSPSPLAEMAMSWVGHFSAVTPWDTNG